MKLNFPEEIFDLVCVGGGGAAIMAAVNAASAGLKVALVTKDYPGFGNTRLAVGMAACPGILPPDSPAIFTEDLVRSGEGINEKTLVENLSREGLPALQSLEELGLYFRRDKEGLITEGVVDHVGGHSLPRSIQNTGGGPALGAYLKAALYRYGISVYSNTAALELVKVEGRVCGLMAIDLHHREFIAFHCRNLVIATGGCSALYYPHTTNSIGAVGDGLTLALQAGARLIDMEQVQAIPFGITHPRSMAGALCGEPSTAGPAGRLLNSSGEVILDGGINKMNRAEVTRAMMAALAENGRGTEAAEAALLLDLSQNLKLPDGDKLYKRTCKSGIFDVVKIAYGQQAYRWKEPWSVLPTFHYQMGGILTDVSGNTGIAGLLAAGEVQGGLHGGNRLGSTALTEIYSAGVETGKAVGREAGAGLKNSGALPGKVPGRRVLEEQLQQKKVCWEDKFAGKGSNNPLKLRRRLENTMWHFAGPLRSEKGLLQALENLAQIELESRSLAIDPLKTANRQLLDAFELLVMLPAARVLVLCALERRESRGAHLRSDCPQKDDNNYLCHTFVSAAADGGLKSGLLPIGCIAEQAPKKP